MNTTLQFSQLVVQLFYNACSSQGIQGSNTDLLICGVAAERDIPIFTTDRDFERYETILPSGAIVLERRLSGAHIAA